MAKSKWPVVEAQLDKIRAWSNNGLSEKQIVHNLGIGKTTFEKFKKEHPELSELLKNGRINQVEEVENALYKSSTGFYYYIQEAVKTRNADGSESVTVVSVKKFKPPETAAMCFFLKNKAKQNWADQPRVIDLRAEELDFRKKQSEFKEW